MPTYSDYKLTNFRSLEAGVNVSKSYSLSALLLALFPVAVGRLFQTSAIKLRI